MTTSGISDKVRIFKEATWATTAGATEKIFGHFSTIEWNIDTHTKQHYGLEAAAPQPIVNIDGVLDVNGKAKWLLCDGRELECIFGTLTDAGSGSFTLAVANTLPTYYVDTVLDDVPSYLQILGMKFGKLSFAFGRDADPEINADWIAQTFANGSSFSPGSPTRKPLTYLDGKVQFTGGDIVGVEQCTLDIDRGVTAKRFVQNQAANKKRLITDLIEGVLKLSISGQLTCRKDLVDKVRGTTDGTIADERTDTTMNIVFSNSIDTLNLAITGFRMTGTGRQLKKDEEVVLMSFTATALGITGSGTYS